MKEKNKNKIQILTPDHNAITLIALVITIIVMLILVGVSVSIAINGGLFSTVKKATAETQYQEDREMLLSAVIGAINNNAEVDYEELDANLPEGFTVSEGLYTSKAGNKFCVNQSGNILTPPEVTVGGKTVALTPKNVATYLGKVVTNYKKSDTETETITIGEKQYTVSTKYRLYYVDFDNKYKDGEGTIYLKADCIENTDNNKDLQTTTPLESDVVKIKELNPELYKNGNPPNKDNTNMKAVTWLTNTNNWKDLKSNLNGINESDINYVVGAPSLEMMVDSYNTHYGLTDEKLNTSELTANSPRVKLFYKYPYNESRCGYGVGPSNNESAIDGYFDRTSKYTVQGKKDSEVDVGTMYCPCWNKNYWLASPASDYTTNVMSVQYYFVGIQPRKLL